VRPTSVPASGNGVGPTRVGQARPSHLVYSAGVGATVDLPSMSVVVRGLDAWDPERAAAITEPRLLESVRRLLGQQVRVLRAVPSDPSALDDPWARAGVPVTPFPRWVRCPRCFRLGPLDPPGQFELVHRWGRRPDLAKWVHAGCQKQARVRNVNRRACVPARFLVTCEDGHLDDFPYVEFVHRGLPCAGPKLTMSDSSSTLGPRVLVRCAECGKQRNISEAAGRKGAEVLPLCRGRHPHLQHFEQCGKPLHLMVLGASNLWFALTASALHLPQSLGVADIVAANWELLGELPNAALVQMLVDRLEELRGLRQVPAEEIWACIEDFRAKGGPGAAAVGGGTGSTAEELLADEWQMLARPTTDKHDDDFRAEVAGVPEGYEGLFDQVVRVTRLREVRALVGFTRNALPETGDAAPVHRVPLSLSAPTWVPAVEQRGEGIFLQLREDKVAQWEATAKDNPRVKAVRDAYVRWCLNRGAAFRANFPLARYLLLHTLSHLLIRQIALECGYSSASVRERIYVGNHNRPHAGVLLSTAASDSEGTLGGLVALGQPALLKRLLDQALEDGRRCSSDPLCAEHVPMAPSEEQHAAACHACLFASETTCEVNNRWLDRAVLVDITKDGLAFPLM